jgi:hypothetical protein
MYIFPFIVIMYDLLAFVYSVHNVFLEFLSNIAVSRYEIVLGNEVQNFLIIIIMVHNYY